MQSFVQPKRRALARCDARWLGWLSTLIYLAVAVLSLDFRGTEEPAERPLLLVLGLFGLASVLYLVSLATVVAPAAGPDQLAAAKNPRRRISFRSVLAFSILFRLVLLFSVPIQEIDYFRYLWDGRVLWQGHNPYQFSPAQVDAADSQSSQAVSELAELGIASDSVNEIFSRIHHRHVPTIYPPLAQALFAVCAALTPIDAPVWIHLFVLKMALVAADVLILFVMRSLLRLVHMADGWTVAYGWCPLAIKETANSAHVDALAVLCTLLALYLLLRASRATAPRWGTIAWLAAGGTLGLAILSKSYPVILLPLVAAYAVAHVKLRGLAVVAACMAVVAGGYLPFVQRAESRPRDPAAAQAVAAALPPEGSPPAQQGPLTGLETFLSTWQMNDLLFMIVHENLRRPQAGGQRTFVVMPAAWREAINRRGDTWLAQTSLPPGVDPAFLMTQFLMGTLLLGLLSWWALRVYRQPDALVLLRCAFLVLAWSWMLASAQNPWYVLWFLPLAPFARCRSWFLIPGLSLIYYLRFWMIYHGMLNAQTGECPAFDFGWVWCEHGTVLVALAVESWMRRNRVAGQSGCAAPAEFGGSADSSASSSAD